MPSAAKKLATYEDVLAAPAHQVAQLVDGELVLQPRPAIRHARVGTRLTSQLEGRFGDDESPDGPGGWVILFEPELHLGADILVPDIAAWRRERMPELPDAAYLELPPDFCGEILSPSTARFDRSKKLPLYAAQGVGHVWLVDPAPKTLEVLALDGATYRLLSAHGGADVVSAPPFESAELRLAPLWSR
ncbi:MAG: Uma2 family endonuclease [Deltaproteobacteria bacterium]|nr:Uma2 family endonuclease [Deltaproteobacteria bacterium]